MKTEKPASEPSMDEILASIREIISSDPKKTEKPLTSRKEQEDILDLTEALPEDESPKKTQTLKEKKEEPKQKSIPSPKEDLKPSSEEFSKPHQKSIQPTHIRSREKEYSISDKEGFFEPLKDHSEKPEEIITQEFLSTPTFDEPLVSETAMSEAAQALHTLNKLAQERPRIPEPRLDSGIGGQTVENLVREILRPLLKEWLENNLPTLVRWVVNEQVEKIVRQLGVTPPESNSDKSKNPPKF